MLFGARPGAIGGAADEEIDRAGALVCAGRDWVGLKECKSAAVQDCRADHGLTRHVSSLYEVPRGLLKDGVGNIGKVQRHMCRWSVVEPDQNERLYDVSVLRGWVCLGRLGPRPGEPGADPVRRSITSHHTGRVFPFHSALRRDNGLTHSRHYRCRRCRRCRSAGWTSPDSAVVALIWSLSPRRSGRGCRLLMRLGLEGERG